MGEVSRRRDPENNSRHWYPRGSVPGPPPPIPRIASVQFSGAENALVEISGRALVFWGLCWGPSPAVNSLV